MYNGVKDDTEIQGDSWHCAGFAPCLQSRYVNRVCDDLSRVQLGGMAFCWNIKQAFIEHAGKVWLVYFIFVKVGHSLTPMQKCIQFSMTSVVIRYENQMAVSVYAHVMVSHWCLFSNVS